MIPTPRELQRLAAETGFRVSTLEKVHRLGSLLHAIQRNADLEDKLVLKGGTALNLLQQTPRRLSVDLDFNYVASMDREAMLRDRPVVEAALEAIATHLGYRVQTSRDSHAGRKLYLGYQSVLGTPDRVEIDVNYLHRVCLLPTRRRILRFGVLPPTETSVLVLSDAELVAGKLCAFLDRNAARDLWDVAHLPELVQPWPPADLRPVFVALASALPHPLQSYELERTMRVTEEEASRLLQPMLNQGERLDLAGLQARAHQVVDPLLDLSPVEREFCRRLTRGEIDAELLFPGRPDLASRLAHHPVVRWKAQNVTAFVRGHEASPNAEG